MPALSPILVAVDGSACSGRAVERAAELAERIGGSIILLHCHRVPAELEGIARHYATGVEYERSIRAQLEAESRAMLHDLAAGLRARGLDIAMESRAGEAGPTIVAAGTELAAAWVFVGTRGRTAVKRLLLGSVATYVVHHADRPVVVVP